MKKKISELMKLSNEEKEDVIEKYTKKDCVSNCPIYNECAKKMLMKGFFCVIEKKVKIASIKKGDICPTCPFGRKYRIGVKYKLYCTRDAELEQRKM